MKVLWPKDKPRVSRSDLSVEVVFVLIWVALGDVQLHVVSSRVSVLAMFAGEARVLFNHINFNYT